MRLTPVEEIEAARAELDAVSMRANRLRRLPDTTLRLRPSQRGWSALECVAHLNATSDAFLPVLSAGISRAPASPSAAPMRLELMARVFLWYLNPPYRIGTRTPGRFEPAPIVEAVRVFDDFELRQARVEVLLRQAQGRRLDQVKVVSPFDARFSYSLFAAFRLFAAHERRHLWQAERAAGAGRGT